MSMTREQMLSYMENPALLNEKTLVELKEILDEFPYFQTARLLYTRNLLNENNFRFANQLKICAIHATDRKVLYHLLNPVQAKEEFGGEASVNSQGINESVQPKETEKTIKQKKTSPANLNYDQIEPSYSLEGTDAESGTSLGQMVKEINESAGKHKKDKITESNDNLIDRFLKENPVISKGGSAIPENIYGETDQDDTPNENDEFITETLAKIYIKQGLYQKAINAFQKLTLKYPEKSVYFARQIEEVTKLLNK
jgi:tetratricopeptide (TPR) repeat protein